MSQYQTRKRTRDGKAGTLARRQTRRTKYATPRTLDAVRRDLGLTVEVTL